MIYAIGLLSVKENMQRGFHHIGLPGMRRELLLLSAGGSFHFGKTYILFVEEKGRRNKEQKIKQLSHQCTCD